MASTRHFEGSFCSPYILFYTKGSAGFYFGGAFPVLFSIFSLYAFINAPGCTWNISLILVSLLYFYIVSGYFGILWIFLFCYLSMLDQFYTFFYIHC